MPVRRRSFHRTAHDSGQRVYAGQALRTGIGRYDRRCHTRGYRRTLHLHNTRNTGLANAWAGVQAGVNSLDSSFGGVGGCPFAPAATGNIPTEDLVYLLERAGIDTGVDINKAISAAEFLEAALEKPVPGMVMKAGVFPQEKTAAA